MKISLNWIKEYVDIQLPLPQLLQKIGAQLGAVEEVVELGPRYKGVVVVSIVSSEKHPDADKLTVCKIDDGGQAAGVERDPEGHVQVVCGAPNVRAGMKAAWLPPGSVVPESFVREPMHVGIRDIRGVKSFGMLASARELGISDEHDGIVEIELEAAPGADFAETYKLNDVIIDIENKMFTHRPDLFGIIGVAREIAGITGMRFQSPAWYSLGAGEASDGGSGLALQIDNQLPELVPRLCAVSVAGVSVSPSPLYMQTLLGRVGIRPINTIVDITNYMMVLTAQPLHAFDYDKLKSASGDDTVKLAARRPEPGETLALLNGKTIELNQSAIVIAGNGRAAALGGIMGGADTEVDAGTRNIVLECANFDMYAVRRSAMSHGVFSDAATRFTKGQSPAQNAQVLRETVARLSSACGGSAGQVADSDPSPKLPVPVRAGVGFINGRLGLELDSASMSRLLQNVEFSIAVEGDDLIVSPPFWRTDIVIAEDVVEEVGRLYGYDHLPLRLPKKDLSPAKAEPQLTVKTDLRNLMRSAGANELLTYSFINGKLLLAAGQDAGDAYHIRNALSPDLQYYRLSLTPSLLGKVHGNIRAGTQRFVIFEAGSAHHKSAADDSGLPLELRRLSAVIAADDKSSAGLSEAPYFSAKRYAELAAASLGIRFSYRPLSDGLDNLPPPWKAAAGPFERSRSAVLSIGDETAGLVGEPNELSRTALKLPRHTAMLELDTGVLLANRNPVSDYAPLNRFPASSQDITLRVDSQLPYETLQDALSRHLADAAAQHGYKTHLEGTDIFKPELSSDTRNITFTLSVEHPQRTLTTDEVSELVGGLSAYAKDAFAAELV